jgi:organic hydroperoxide reductase OsmC/OhrA
VTVATKEYSFPVSVRRLPGRRSVASVHGKDDLEVAAPPEFKGGVEGVWSPEDLFVGSVATCYAVTLAAIAERRDVPLRTLDVGATGRVARRADGRFGFTEVVLDAILSTDPGREKEAARAAEAAERGCLVSVSLDLPVRLELEVRTAPLVEATP